MKNSGKIYYINLALLLVYSIVIRISVAGDKGGILGLSCLIISAHVALCFLTGLILLLIGNREYGNDFLLSSGLVLLIGFGVCWGNASI